MLPQYADGSKKGNKGKKVKKKMSVFQCCLLMVALMWVLGVAGHIYRQLDRKNGPDSAGFIGLVMLGPNSAYGRQWVEKCEAFLQSIEDRFPVPGWTADTEAGIGKYREGEYVEQIRVRELEIAKEIAKKELANKHDALSGDPLAHARPIGAVAGEMGNVLGADTTLDSSASGSPVVHSAQHVLPEGSYQGSCGECVLMGFAPHYQLKCSKCRDGSGQFHETVVRLDACKEDEWVGNSNGRLACEPIPTGAAAIATLRQGGHELAAKKAEKFAADKAASIDRQPEKMRSGATADAPSIHTAQAASVQNVLAGSVSGGEKTEKETGQTTGHDQELKYQPKEMANDIVDTTVEKSAGKIHDSAAPDTSLHAVVAVDDKSVTKWPARKRGKGWHPASVAILISEFHTHLRSLTRTRSLSPARSLGCPVSASISISISISISVSVSVSVSVSIDSPSRPLSQPGCIPAEKGE